MAMAAPSAVPATQAPPSQAMARVTCDRAGRRSYTSARMPEFIAATHPQVLSRQVKQMTLATIASRAMSQFLSNVRAAW
jgi:hypothetical protein